MAMAGQTVRGRWIGRLFILTGMAANISEKVDQAVDQEERMDIE